MGFIRFISSFLVLAFQINSALALPPIPTGLQSPASKRFYSSYKFNKRLNQASGPYCFDALGGSTPSELVITRNGSANDFTASLQMNMDSGFSLNLTATGEMQTNYILLLETSLDEDPSDPNNEELPIFIAIDFLENSGPLKGRIRMGALDSEQGMDFFVNEGLCQNQASTDLTQTDLPQIVTSDFIDLNIASHVSLFRGAVGRPLASGGASCQTMSHHYRLKDCIHSESQTVSAPFNGVIVGVQYENQAQTLALKTNLNDSLTVILHNVLSEFKLGDHFLSGELLGSLPDTQTTQVTAHVYNGTEYEYVSYIELLDTTTFSRYQTRGLLAIEDVILSETDPSLATHTCVDNEYVDPTTGFAIPTEVQFQNDGFEFNGLTIQPEINMPGCNMPIPGTSFHPPHINEFLTTPSTQFLIDIEYVDWGHPFKGDNAIDPHQGAHVHVNNLNNQWPNDPSIPDATETFEAIDEGDAPSRLDHYMPIYAVADGIIQENQNYVGVSTSSNGIYDHYRYGIDLWIANTDTGEKVLMHHAIEPLIIPMVDTFYEPFMIHPVGTEVTEGEIIGYFFLPSGQSNGAHIHFNLTTTSSEQKYAPSIFSEDIMNDFYDSWGDRGRTDGDITDPNAITADIGVCMGWEITAEENIFANTPELCQP